MSLQPAEPGQPMPWTLVSYRGYSRKRFLKRLWLCFLQGTPWPYLLPWPLPEAQEWKPDSSPLAGCWMALLIRLTRY